MEVPERTETNLSSKVGEKKNLHVILINHKQELCTRMEIFPKLEGHIFAFYIIQTNIITQHIN